MNREAFKLARETLRLAVKEYGWQRRRISFYAGDRPGTRTEYSHGPGKFEGEHWSIVHYYDAMMNGSSDEPFYDGETCQGTPFEVTDVERAAFGFAPATQFVVILHSESGFESLQELTCEEYDEMREAYDAESTEES